MKTKVTKNQTASVGKYSYQYVDIAQIHEYLEANNLEYDENGNIVEKGSSLTLKPRNNSGKNESDNSNSGSNWSR